jgi:hypothetical protein
MTVHFMVLSAEVDSFDWVILWVRVAPLTHTTGREGNRLGRDAVVQAVVRKVQAPQRAALNRSDHDCRLLVFCLSSVA